MKVTLSNLQDTIIKILSSTYYSKSQARDIADVLLYAEMTGKNTQGFLKLLGKEPIQTIKPKSEPKVVKETKLSALINGGGNPGILVSHMATALAIKKAKEMGFAIVGSNNTFSSTGAIGYYAAEMAKNNLIGVVMAGSPGGVAPFGGLDPLFGTNPIAFGFPTQDDPLIFDMATAAITWYGLVRAKALGQEIPKGIAIDHDGNLTTDPEKAMGGAILPFDKNYKGSGLSMMIEIFTGPLVGAAFADSVGTGDWGNVFIAIDPELLVGKEAFKKNASQLIKKIKDSRPVKGGEAVRVPGEKGVIHKKMIEKSGSIEIDETLFNQLQNILRAAP